MSKAARFRDKGAMARVMAMLALDPETRARRTRQYAKTKSLAPRWSRVFSRPGPFNRDQEAERRRRQIAKGMLKVTR